MSKLGSSIESWLARPEQLARQEWWKGFQGLDEGGLDRSVALQAAVTRLSYDTFCEKWLLFDNEKKVRAIEILAAHLLGLDKMGLLVIEDVVSEGLKGG